MKKKTHEDFIKDLKQVNSNEIIIIGKYLTARDKIAWQCKKCSNIFYAAPKHLYNYSGFCKKCISIETGINKKNSSSEIFLKRLQEDGKFVLLDDYKGANEQVRFKCLFCNYEWIASPNNVIRYNNCPKCKIVKSRKSSDIFAKELLSINSNIILLDEYVKATQKIKCKCKLCDYIWEVKPQSLLNGVGCPSCNHTSTSFVEQAILLSFSNVLGENNVFSRDKKTIGKELDIYIPSLHLAIEFGAWHWHKQNLKNDELKSHLCKQKGIRLIRVYDSVKENVYNFEDTILYKYNLSQNHEELKKLIMYLFKISNIKKCIDSEEWNIILEKAYIKSRKMTTEDFKSKLKKINKNVLILGEYKSSNSQIKVSCLKCNYVWYPTPDSLLSNRSHCPQCSGVHTNKKSHEEFVEDLQKKNPNIKLLEKYTNGREKKKFSCLICNYEWYALPKHILRGHGCPKCKGNNQSKRLTKTNEKFLEELSKINPTVMPLEDYKGNSTHILCQCKKCEGVWKSTPRNLLSKRGCPNCYKNRRLIKNLSK